MTSSVPGGETAETGMFLLVKAVQRLLRRRGSLWGDLVPGSGLPKADNVCGGDLQPCLGSCRRLAGSSDAGMENSLAWDLICRRTAGVTGMACCLNPRWGLGWILVAAW